MAKGTLFEYAVLYHPPTKRSKDGEGEETGGKTKLIGTVGHVVAASPETAAMVAVRSLPEEYADKLDDLEVIVHPFGSA